MAFFFGELSFWLLHQFRRRYQLTKFNGIPLNRVKGSYKVQSTELVIGLVGAVGTDMESVIGELTKSLRSVGYTAVPIHLINALRQIDRWSNLPDKPLDERYRTHMDAGDEFRGLFESGDAMALLGIASIQKERHTFHGETASPAKKAA